MPIYQVRLVQHEWVNTETFQVDAKSEEEARSYVEKHDLKNKDLDDKEFRLDVEELVNENPDGPVAETRPTEGGDNAETTETNAADTSTTTNAARS